MPDVVSELPGWLSAGVDFGHIAAELGPILGESHSRDRILAGLPSEDFERTLAGQRNAGGLYLDYVLANAGMDRPRLSAIGPDDPSLWPQPSFRGQDELLKDASFAILNHIAGKFLDQRVIVRGSTALSLHLVNSRAPVDLDISFGVADIDSALQVAIDGADQLKEHDWRLRWLWVMKPSTERERTWRRIRFGVDNRGVRHGTFDLDLSNSRHGVQSPATPVVTHPALARNIAVAALETLAADKVSATLRPYGRIKGPSRRYRDLVDLVVMTKSGAMKPELLRQGLVRARLRDRQPITGPYLVPEPTAWSRGYSYYAASCSALDGMPFGRAYQLVRSRIDPVLSTRAAR